MSNARQTKQTQGTSRRDFLATSAGVLSAAAVGGLSLARSAHAAGSDVLKVGLIGCGGRGSGAAANAMNADKSVKLVAMADIFGDRLESALNILKKQKPGQVLVDKDHSFVGFDGYQKVIASGVDLVLIACASRYHPIYAKAALEAGKHVFVEKPAAIDPAGVHMIEEATKLAQAKNLNFAAGLCYRYEPAKRETVKRVHDGAIGEILAVEENYLRSPYRLVPKKDGQTEVQSQFYNWYHFNWLSGDDIPQSLIHNLDKAQWVLKEEEPVSAHGVGGRSASFGPVYGNVFDHYAAVYEYKSGIRLYAHGRTQVGCHSEVSDIIIGTKGRCYLQKHRIEGAETWEYKGPKVNMYDAEHVELVAAIRAGKRIDNGLIMARSTMVGILGQFAVYTGKKITWEEINASKYSFPPASGPVDFSIEPPVKPEADGTYPVPVPGMTKLS